MVLNDWSILFIVEDKLLMFLDRVCRKFFLFFSGNVLVKLFVEIVDIILVILVLIVFLVVLFFYLIMVFVCCLLLFMIGFVIRWKLWLLILIFVL